VVKETACDQPLDFNLGERRRTARLMSAWESYAEVRGFENDEGARNDGRQGFKGNNVSNRTGGRSAAKGAVVKMSVELGVVMMMRRHRECRGTQLQQERRAARRHEACRNVRSEQQHRQQDAAQQALPPMVKHMLAHADPSRTMPWPLSVCQWGNTLHCSGSPAPHPCARGISRQAAVAAAVAG